MRQLNSPYLERIILFAPAIALALSLTVVFFSHGYFSIGVWRRAEPVIIAFHATSSLCTLALVGMWLKDKARMCQILCHPLVAIPGALALWSALTAPFAKFPLLSIFGSPQLGEGALWYANIAVLIACALLASENKVQWRFLTIWSIFIVVGVCIIKITAKFSGTYELFWIKGFFAYFAFALPFMCLRHSEGYWRWVWPAAIIASIGVLYVAESRSANILFGLGVFYICANLVISSKTLVGRFTRSRSFSLSIVGIVAVAPLLVIGSGLVNGVLSLKSRYLVMTVMKDAQGLDWRSLLFGEGWGRTQDALISHLQASGEMFWLKGSGKWDYLWGDYHHTHNWMVEGLYSVGIPGLILWLLFFLAIPYYSERNTRIFATVLAAIYAGMTTMWFQVSFSLAFIALAVAGVSAKEFRIKSMLKPAHHPLTLGLIIALVAAQISAAVVLTDFSKRSSETIAQYQAPSQGPNTLSFPEDFRNGEHGFALAVREHLVWLQKTLWPDRHPRTNHQAKVIQQIIEDLQRRITKIESPYLIIAGLSLLSDLTYVNHLRYINKKIKNIDQFWEQWIDRLLVIAPRRTDSAITYFSWLLSNKKHEVLAKYAYRVLIQNPNDPIGWFFYGAAFIKDGSAEKRREALRNIKKGIELGIERYMPVKPNLKKMLKAAD